MKRKSEQVPAATDVKADMRDEINVKIEISNEDLKKIKTTEELKKEAKK